MGNSYLMLLVCTYCRTPRSKNFSSVGCECGENSFLLGNIEIGKEEKIKILNDFKETIIKLDSEFSRWFRDKVKDDMGNLLLIKYHLDIGDFDFLKRRFPDMPIEDL